MMANLSHYLSVGVHLFWSISEGIFLPELDGL